jgi:hypothetical protein
MISWTKGKNEFQRQLGATSEGIVKVIVRDRAGVTPAGIVPFGTQHIHSKQKHLRLDQRRCFCLG